MTPGIRDKLDAAALRISSSDPAYMGYWLDRHCTHEKLSNEALAGKLGLTPDRLAVLALCRAPGGSDFASQISKACELTGADVAALTALLRQEQVLAAWAAPRPTPASTTGWMMAAHDADQPPPGDEDSPDGYAVD